MPNWHLTNQQHSFPHGQRCEEELTIDQNTSNRIPCKTSQKKNARLSSVKLYARAVLGPWIGREVRGRTHHRVPFGNCNERDLRGCVCVGEWDGAREWVEVWWREGRRRRWRWAGGEGRMGEEGREFCSVQRYRQPAGELGIAWEEEGGGRRRERNTWYFTTVCQKTSGKPDALLSSEQ